MVISAVSVFQNGNRNNTGQHHDFCQPPCFRFERNLWGLVSDLTKRWHSASKTLYTKKTSGCVWRAT